MDAAILPFSKFERINFSLSISIIGKGDNKILSIWAITGERYYSEGHSLIYSLKMCFAHLSIHSFSNIM